jgi:hypothetical protein
VATTLKLGLGCYSNLLGTTVLWLHGQLGQVRQHDLRIGTRLTNTGEGGDNVEARVGLLRATTLKLGLGCYGRQR